MNPLSIEIQLLIAGNSKLQYWDYRQSYPIEVWEDAIASIPDTAVKQTAKDWEEILPIIAPLAEQMMNCEEGRELAIIRSLHSKEHLKQAHQLIEDVAIKERLFNWVLQQNNPVKVGDRCIILYPPSRRHGMSGLVIREEDGCFEVQLDKPDLLYLDGGHDCSAALIPADWLYPATAIAPATPPVSKGHLALAINLAKAVYDDDRSRIKRLSKNFPDPFLLDAYKLLDKSILDKLPALKNSF